MGEPLRKPSPRLHFDIGGKLAEHVVEQRDLVAGIAARAGGKEIGDAFKNAQALCVAAGRDRFVEFVDQRFAGSGSGTGIIRQIIQRRDDFKGGGMKHGGNSGGSIAIDASIGSASRFLRGTKIGGTMAIP